MIKAIVFTALALLALGLFAACGGATKEKPAATPPGGAGGELGPATVVPAPTVSPEPIPADWATYTDPAGRFAFRYPATWHVLLDGGIYSWDPTTWTKPTFPPDGIKLEVIVGSMDQAESRPEGATDTSIAATTGWEIVYTYDPSSANGIARVHQIAVDREGYRFFMIAYFGPENVDEATFSQILSSFQFTQSSS